MTLLERAPAAPADSPTPGAGAATLRRAALFVGFVWLPIVLLWSGGPFAFTFDDAFYYAEVARHVADGAGSTFDGLNATNGYHPLWLVLSVPVYLVGLDGTAAIRALLTAELAMWVGALVVVARIAARRLADAPRSVHLVGGGILFLAGANPFVIKMVVNGLESAPAVLVAALLLDRLDHQGGRFLGGTPRDRLVTGGLLALAFLARTDAIVLLGCVAAWCAPEARRLGRAGLRAAVDLLGPPAAVVVAYLATNLLWFGQPTQVSGEIKRLALTPGRAAALAVAAAVAVALMVRLAKDRPDSRLPRLAAFTRHSGWYAGFLVLLLAYYLGLSSQVWLWYFAPVGLYVVTVLAVGTIDLADGALTESGSVRPIAAILAGPLILGAVIAGRQFADPELRSIQEANRDAGEWISSNLPDDAVLGSWDAGVLGYFTDQPVINLDGVANSFEYLDASRAGRQDELLRDQGITHLANHGAVVDGDDPDLPDLADDLLGPGTGDGLEQVRRWEFTYSGTTTGSTGPAGTDRMAVFVYELPDGG